MKRILLAIASIGLLGIGLAPSARADEWNKKTTITVNQPIQVPGMVLPAGTYVLKLTDSQSDRHIVQIFNEDQTELQTTILAIPNYRIQPTAGTVITYWETPPGQPAAVRAWFYPGDNFGQEFAYPKMEATEIAAVAHAEVPTVETQKPAELAIAPIEKVEPPAPVAEAPAAPAQEEIAAAPAPPLEPTPVAELPKTASPYPLIALVGALSLLAFAVVRILRES